MRPVGEIRRGHNKNHAGGLQRRQRLDSSESDVDALALPWGELDGESDTFHHVLAGCRRSNHVELQLIDRFAGVVMEDDGLKPEFLRREDPRHRDRAAEMGSRSEVQAWTLCEDSGGNQNSETQPDVHRPNSTATVALRKA